MEWAKYHLNEKEKMPKTQQSKLPENFSNPFLSPERDKLWERLYRNAKPVSKEELFNKVKALREKGKG